MIDNIKFKQALSFDDILLKPADFTNIKSRSDVDTSVEVCGSKLTIPVIASNMDSVYSPKLSQEIIKHGGMACTHRFCSIEENIEMFKSGMTDEGKPWVSIGVSDLEKERASALVHSGAEVVLIDLAHGAQQQCVDQYDWLRSKFSSNVKIVVGNFATKEQIRAFLHHSKSIQVPDLIKINVGSGSVCKTRVVTGVGLPSVETIIDCRQAGLPLMQDGGIKNSGDLCKALALGCDCAMVGNLFASCWESATPVVGDPSSEHVKMKRYRGSASASSYTTQNKTSKFRAPEGVEITIPISGTVEQLMHKLDGGLRSSMTYLNARNIKEFKEHAEFVTITNNGLVESKPHGAL